MSISRTLLVVTAIAMACAASLTWAPQAHALSCLQPGDPAAVLTGKPKSNPIDDTELLRRPMHVIDGVLLSVQKKPNTTHRDGVLFIAGMPEPRIATVLVIGTSWGDSTQSMTPAPPLVTRITLQSVFTTSLQVGDRFLADVRHTPVGWRVEPCAAYERVTTPLIYPQRRSISQLLGLASLTTKH